MFISISCIALLFIVTTLCLELARDLMMYQQNSYRPERYRRWLGESRDTTSVSRLLGLVIFFIALSTLSHPVASLAFTGVFGIVMSYKLFSRKYKKPLAWTARARRIYTVSLMLSAAVAVAAVFLFAHADAFSVLFTITVALLGCYCASHGLILLAGLILSPVEKAINRRYYNDAAQRLASMPDLKIVGITGSYGKTSTKHYLYRILSEQFDTLMTPGSFNTTLGVVRTVREYLKPYNEVFIVEMGAKQPGDIKEICDLVHPHVGIVTAVGPQHLESFKTLERVQSTKFELVDALPADGIAIVNNDFEKIADRKVDNVKCLRYGVGNTPGAAYRAEDVKYTPDGTTFVVNGPDGWKLPLSTRLMGECNVSDLLAAAVCAHALGVSDEKIAVAVASIDPVEHRLSVKKTPAGITILDDAFNSNPVGSRMALEVLGAMGPGKRIVITPGMIELGSEQFELNKALGETIARNADVAIIVGEYNREPLVEGINSVGSMSADVLHTVETFTEAQKLLAGIVKAGDTVLYENDLPDTFK
ncbi:MAG: UDP-N-acetylmuramoyl-tripeptide--D-alanyl-D-alanine ligase [Muribaculaceae bacterium]|nr:UDP-N-acetylmuramoyl-tripeptide--D-alanyl-D-alanine ligase [Muribaculaceae bacterium]